MGTNPGRKMQQGVLSRFGIYKKPSNSVDFRSPRSTCQTLCFFSIVAVVFLLSISMTLLDYTYKATAITIPNLKLERIYSNHRHISARSEISNLDENPEVKLKQTNDIFPNGYSSNTTLKNNTTNVKTNTDDEHINIQFVVSKPYSQNEGVYSHGDNTTNIAFPVIRRQYYGNVLPSRKQRILNNPPSRGMSTYGTETYPQLNPPIAYEYSPVRVFTDSYAQLRPYVHQNNINSINDVLQYMDPSQVSITTPMPNLMETSNNKRKIKFTGTYIRPLADESTEGSEEMPTLMLPMPPGKLDEARPFIKGQNFSDPFKTFRPINPLEINQLLPPSSGSKFPRENKGRFMSPFLPTPPFKVKPTFPLDPASIQTPNTSAGTTTVAIFHPNDPERMAAASEQREYKKRRKRPFSLMLDIYPVQNDVNPVTATSNTKYATIPHHLWGPYRPPPSGDELLQQQASNTLLRPDNRMVVHLNLYPKKLGKGSKYRRGRSNKDELMTVLSGGIFNKKSSGNGDLNLSRNTEKDNLNEDEMTMLK